MDATLSSNTNMYLIWGANDILQYHFPFFSIYLKEVVDSLISELSTPKDMQEDLVVWVWEVTCSAVTFSTVSAIIFSTVTTREPQEVMIISM